MLVVAEACKEYFDSVEGFAKQVGAKQKLQESLDYLGGYACHDTSEDTKVILFKDFAPNSFAFTMYKKQSDGEYKYWFNGGLIYSGPGQPLDGSFPALTVSIDPNNGKAHDWSVHT